ncbi:MAG: AraC family transcriptional regulator [Sterolibacterium sp.]
MSHSKLIGPVDQNNQNIGNPLSGFRIFQTMDLDEARDLVAKVYTPHSLGFAGPHGRHVDTAMSHFPIGEISLNRLRYGAKVTIDAACLNSFLLVMMPLTGRAVINCGDQHILSTPKLASVISPDLPLREIIDADCDQVMVRIDKELLERICAQHIGHELSAPVRFDLGLDLSGIKGSRWSALVSYLLAEIDSKSPLMNSLLLRTQIEHLVVTTLLLTQNHNYSNALSHPARIIAPSHVKRVEDYICAHADEPLTISELAAYAKVSTSSLFAGFRAFRKTTPMAHLKSVRLQRANEELRRANRTSETVANVAMRWGFGHLSYFAKDYRKMFGELPSETLRK